MTTTIPPPRRKSCTACVKAKRRCDLLTPQCTRCFQKSLECVYHGQVPRKKNLNPCGFNNAVFPRQAAFAPTSDPSMQPGPILLDLPDFNFDAMSYEMPYDFNAGQAFMDFVPSFPIPPFPAEYPTPDSLASNASSDASAKIYSHEDYDHLDDICDDYNSDQLNDDTTRVACAVAAIRAWHKSMAFSFSTPFMHRQLYAQHDRPRIINDVFTSCLMFATKKKHTEGVIMPLIENNASTLIIENSSHDVTPTMALARAQALLLYQSMREAQYVDRDQPILQKWIEHLANLRDQTTSDHNAVLVARPGNWDSWMFWECVSRTVLAASFFINVHSLIAKGEHPLGEWSKPHMWTASKRLWSAENSEEFYERWQKRKPVVVCNLFLNHFMQEGNGDDVDAFASMLMVPTLGLAGTKKWINETKGRVEELTTG